MAAVYEGRLSSQDVRFTADAVVQATISAEEQDVLRVSGNADADVAIVGVAAPTIASGAANKLFVESLVYRNPTKVQVHVASTQNVDLASSPGSMDGWFVTGNERVLLKNQTIASENGIYLSDGSYMLSRAPDMPTNSHAAATEVTVLRGNANEGSRFTCSAIYPDDVVGTDGLSWEQGGYKADETSIVSSHGEFSVKNGGVTNQKLAAATDTTDASSASTGALVTAGGIGVAKNVYAGGALYTLSTTDASNVTTGSVVASGGLGVAKKAFFGDVVAATASTSSTSSTTGALVVTGGIGCGGDGRFGGDVHAVAHYTTSDARFKTNVQPLQDALVTVCGMEGVTFDWIESGKPACGLVAQQVLPVAPLLVDTSNPEKLELEYTRVVPYLIEAIKSLKRQVDAQASTSSAKRSKQ